MASDGLLSDSDLEVEYDSEDDVQSAACAAPAAEPHSTDPAMMTGGARQEDDQLQLENTKEGLFDAVYECFLRDDVLDGIQAMLDVYTSYTRKEQIVFVGAISGPMLAHAVYKRAKTAIDQMVGYIDAMGPSDHVRVRISDVPEGLEIGDLSKRWLRALCAARFIAGQLSLIGLDHAMTSTDERYMKEITLDIAAKAKKGGQPKKRCRVDISQ